MAKLAHRLIWEKEKGALKNHLGISGTGEDGRLEEWFWEAVEAADGYLERDWPDDAAQEHKFTVNPGVAQNDTFKIIVNSQTGAYTAGAAEDESAVAAALRTNLAAAVAAEPVTVTGAGAEVIVTSNTPGLPFSDQVLYDDAGGGDSGFDEEIMQESVRLPQRVVNGLYEYVGALRRWHGRNRGVTSVRTGQYSESYGKGAADEVAMLAARSKWRRLKEYPLLA